MNKKPHKEGRGLPTRLKIQIRDLQEDFIIDQLAICRSETLSGIPSYEEGFVRKNRWLSNMLKTNTVSKLAYIDRGPLGMIQFYPESCIPFLNNKREDVLRLDCIYVTKELQGEKIGRALLKTMITDAKQSERFSRVVTSTFNSQSGYPQPKFLREAGFTRIPGGNEMELEYPLTKKTSVSRGITPTIEKSEPQRIEGEEGAKLFYEPRCPLSTYFNNAIAKTIHEIEPSLRVEEIDMWANPERAIQRGIDRHTVYVNGEPIKEFYMNKEPFRKELNEILNRSV